MPVKSIGTESSMPSPPVKKEISSEAANVPKTGSSVVSQLISGFSPMLGAASISIRPEGISLRMRGDRLNFGYCAAIFRVLSRTEKGGACGMLGRCR